MSSDIHALSGAYAVDALDDAERAEFEQHLAVCPTCRAEVADLQAAAVEIAATTEATPPPSLRAAVLAGISEVRPLPPANVRTLPRRRAWTRIGLAAAAAAVVAGGVTVAVHPWDQQQTVQHYASAVDRVIHAPDAQRFTAHVKGGGEVTVYRSVALDRAAVVARDMPAAPAGHVYELWLQSPAGAMLPGGLFSEGSDLSTLVRGRAGVAKALGITIEKAGGSRVPTTNPIALVTLT
jgi:anti-sigma factor RsiW